MTKTLLGLSGVPATAFNLAGFAGKTVASSAQTSVLVFQFDQWREGYAGAVVSVFIEGTSTLATLYTDPGLTTLAANPQTLITKTIGLRTAGKFPVSIYTASSYYVKINNAEQSGVFYPGLRALNNVDAGNALTTSQKGGVPRTLISRAGDFNNVRDFGNFSTTGSPIENTATLVAAIGVAAGENGDEVLLPPGVYPINAFNIPAGVRLTGQIAGATVLQSVQASAIITITGDGVSLKDFTLDGVNLNPGSVGIYSRNNAKLSIRDVVVKRMATGVKLVGGMNHVYSGFTVTNCTTGVDLRGDSNVNVDNLGGPLRGLQWTGGEISLNSSAGLIAEYIDQPIEMLEFRGLNFINNVGQQAVQLNGTTNVRFVNCNFELNTFSHLITKDVGTQPFSNTEFNACRFNASAMSIGGTALDTRFERCEIQTVAITANNPSQQIIMLDCTIDAKTTFLTNPEKISFWETTQDGILKGQTLPAVSTGSIVWKRQLNPGEVITLLVNASAVQENLPQSYSMQVTGSALQRAATLLYSGASNAVTAGNIITGSQSGATAMVQANAPSTTTWSLIRVSGTFINGEPVVETTPAGLAATGNGNVNGSISFQNTVLFAAGVTKSLVMADPTTGGPTTAGWDMDITTAARTLQLKISGPSTGIVDWSVRVMTTDRP